MKELIFNHSEIDAFLKQAELKRMQRKNSSFTPSSELEA